MEEGTWGNPKTVDQEYAEAKKKKKWPKLTPGEKKPAAGSSVPAVNPDAPLPQ